jgi:outer membrane protein OmpU
MRVKMKKGLLATSAIVAGSLFAGQAAAQVEVSIAGEIRFQAGYVLNEELSATGEVGMEGAQSLGEAITVFPGLTGADRSGDFNAMVDDIRIVVDATADNGLNYGGQARISDEDRARFYVGGAFGTVRLGDWGSAGDQLNINVPSSGRDRFGNDINAYILNAGIADTGVTAGGGASVTYLSTGSALDDTGLTLGLSYAPTSNGDYAAEVRRENAEFNDVGSIAASYNNDFGGVILRAFGQYEFGTGAGGTATVGNTGDYTVLNDAGNVVRTTRNLSAYNLAAGVGFGGFDVGVHYVDRGASGNISGFDDSTWAVGATYTVGPWGFGVSYADGSQNVSVEGEVGGDATRASYNVDEQRLGFGTTFDVAPGLVVAGDLGYNRSKWSASGDVGDENRDFESDAWVGLVTTRLNF